MKTTVEGLLAHRGGGPMIRKYYAVPRAAGEPDDGIMITTSALDLEQDRVFPDGADLESYLANPVILWIHDSYGYSASAGIPVGTTRSLEILPGRGIRATGIDWLEGDPFVDRVRNAWEQGKVRGASIGFLPLEGQPNQEGGYDIRKWRLLEWSLVPIPANPQAVRVLKNGREVELVAKGLKARVPVELLSPARSVESAPIAPVKIILEDERGASPCPINDVSEVLNAWLESRVIALRVLRMLLKQEQGAEVQSVICSKERFETQADATAWVREHDFTVPEGGPDETEETWRYRQFSPDACQVGGLQNGETFSTIRLDEGVQAVICRRGERAAEPPETKVEHGDCEGEMGKAGEAMMQARKHLDAAMTAHLEGRAAAPPEEKAETAGAGQVRAAIAEAFRSLT